MQIKCIHWGGIVCACLLLASKTTAEPPTCIACPTPTPPPIEGAYPSLPNPPYAIVTYSTIDSSAQTASVVSPAVDGIFQLVGLQPDQIVQVIVQYPTSEALEVVNLEALDGGLMLPPKTPPIDIGNPFGCWGESCPNLQPVQAMSLVISADGFLSFTFKATHDPGQNQIRLRNGSQELGLQFWVFDQEDPQANPPAITAVNPYPAANDEP